MSLPTTSVRERLFSWRLFSRGSLSLPALVLRRVCVDAVQLAPAYPDVELSTLRAVSSASL